LLDEGQDDERQTAAASGEEILGRTTHLLLITFHRDGTRVATPVWAAAREGVLYARTQRASGKVKRISNSAEVLIVPCTTRGRPRGLSLPGKARVLSSVEEIVAEKALCRKYGFIRAACALIQDFLRVDMCYLEITPATSFPDQRTQC
jgi:PPOX class probable F420-dependent enzyme